LLFSRFSTFSCKCELDGPALSLPPGMYPTSTTHPSLLSLFLSSYGFFRDRALLENVPLFFSSHQPQPQVAYVLSLFLGAEIFFPSNSPSLFSLFFGSVKTGPSFPPSPAGCRSFLPFSSLARLSWLLFIFCCLCCGNMTTGPSFFPLFFFPSFSSASGAAGFEVRTLRFSRSVVEKLSGCAEVRLLLSFPPLFLLFSVTEKRPFFLSRNRPGTVPFPFFSFLCLLQV